MNGNLKQTNRLMYAGLLLLYLFVGTNMLNAQCTLVCNNPLPSAPLAVSVDENCQAVLTADMVLEDPGACPGIKILEVRTLSGFLIVEGPEPVVVPNAYLGNTIGVTVIDANTWNECTGYMHLTDELDPFFISCPDIVVSCIANTDPSVIGYPIADDNCDTDVTLTYSQTQTGPDCSTPSPYVGTITRTWIATDNFNNQGTCTQIIYLEKATMAEVVFPPTVTQDCENPNTLPAVTGIPSIDGVPIVSGNICMFSASYSDAIIYTCAPATHSYTIIRTWTVVDGCSAPNVVKMQAQNINVVDDTGPSINCQQSITVGTNSDECTGTVFLPPAPAFDNCSDPGDINISVGTSYGGMGLGPHFGVPAGSYTVTYTAIDECGNVSTCVSTLQIADDDAPVAVCDEFTVVSLTSGGAAVVPAFNLDDGSYDNCGPVAFKGSRDGGQTFNSNLTFTCEDVGNPVSVILRVCAANNPGSYNDCSVVVTVLDKLGPAIICPENLTIDCIETYPVDLSMYGAPLVGDNCDYTLTADTTININNCGEGTILRKFSVVDPSGNMAMCTQTLTVQNLTPFDGDLIQWPPEYVVTNACITADQLDPEDLPSSPINYNGPILPDVGCALLATNHSDQVFLIAYPACYKIVRTWIVMDWCTYNPANPDQGGIWYYTQIIKVMDNIAPVFVTLPDDIIYSSVDANCQFGVVNMPTVSATDCSPFITITNNSPYANSGGANASGMYPLGETIVKFSAKDGCGNTALHLIKVIVEDNTPPLIQCAGIITDLAVMQGGNIFAMIDAENLLEQTSDNCTATEDIGVFIRRRDPTAVGPPVTTSLTFTCDDVGPNQVEVWVVDEVGNADYCIVNVVIQDNFFLCPPTVVYTIAGIIETEMGDEVDDVEVHISGSPDTMQMGSPFVFSGQPGSYDYTLAPIKDEDSDNGVTTYDLVLITRHILGVELLDSPYKIIAADVNRSGLVTTVDMVVIRRVILGLDNNFTANKSWRFVDKNFAFTNPQNPFAQPIPEVISLNNLSSDNLYADFVAIKVGDVNGSAAPNQMTDGADQRDYAGVLHLSTENRLLEQGQSYEVAFRGLDFEDIMGLQFTLNLDPEKLEWGGISSCDLPGLGQDNFGEQFSREGQILFSWNAAGGVAMKEEDCLFTIHLKALQTGYLLEWINIDSGRLRTEAYRVGGDLLAVRLQASAPMEEGLRIYQNRPNPFDRSTVIGFSVDRPVQGALVVFDLSGKEVLRHTASWDKGYHEFTVGREQLPGKGMYYYKLETDAITEVRKMILID